MKPKDAAQHATAAPSASLSLTRALGLLITVSMVQTSALAAEQVFTLREVSAFENGGSEFTRGQMGESKAEPYSEVKSYPQFASDKPIYGVVRFDVDYREPDSGTAYYFAIDESKGTGKGYDRLYFDVNRDLDLRNDKVSKPQSKPPENATLQYSDIKEQALFEYLPIPFDLGGGALREVEIMPRLIRSSYEEKIYEQVSFVRTRLFSGKIQVGKQEFEARLGNKYIVTGRLDQPAVALALDRAGSHSDPRWWGGDSLKAMHKVDGVLYTFSANPAGDKLTVRPYAGDLGRFEVGPGSVPLKNFRSRVHWLEPTQQ